MNFKIILQYAFGPIGASFISLITLPLLAFYFEPEDVGRYALLQVFLSLGIMVFTLGLNQSFVREYHEYSNKPSLVLMSSLPCLIVVSIFFLILYISSYSISEALFDIDSTMLSILICISVFLAVLSNQYAHVLRMVEKPLLFSLSAILPRFIFIVALLVSVFFSDQLSIELILYSTLISSVLTIVFFWIAVEDIRLSLRSSFDSKFFFEMIKFGIPLMLGGIAFWGMASIDRFFLKNYSSLSEVALYSMAVSFAAVGSIFTSIFSTIWHPLVYRWNSEGIDKNKLQNILDLALLAICAIWSVVGLMSWIVGYILPAHYAKVIYIMPLCIAVPLIYLLSEITQIGIGIKRKASYIMLISVTCLILNIFLNVVFISKFGAAGAALASSMSFLVLFLLKTEVSNMLVKLYDRSLAYISVFFCMSLSIVYAFFGEFLIYLNFLWLAPFLLICSRYKMVVLSVKQLKAGY